MKVQTSDKIAVWAKKPHIKKGYYAGKLKEVKPRQREDGVAVEGQYGKQIILLWEIYEQDGETPIMHEKEKLVIPSVCYSEYKQKDGSFRTAFTPNSAITKTFKALGWAGPDGEEMDTSEYVGEWAELNIDDYEATFTDADSKEEKYKASTVKDVSALEDEEEKGGEEPSSSEITIPVHDKDTQEKIDKINRLFNEGNLTERGYKTAMEQLGVEK